MLFLELFGYLLIILVAAEIFVNALEHLNGNRGGNPERQSRILARLDKLAPDKNLVLSIRATLAIGTPRHGCQYQAG